MEHWITTWGTAQTNIKHFSPTYADSTMRLSIPNNLEGTALRLRFSNRDGKKPFGIRRGAIHGANGNLPIRFSGKESMELAPGQEVYSDTLPMAVEKGHLITLSIAFRGVPSSGNGIPATVQCSPKGDFVDAPQFKSVHRSKTACYHDMLQSIPALSGVEVLTEAAAKAVICFGDSITQQGRWTEPLAEDLYKMYPGKISVINKGIGGNRLLHGPFPIIGGMYGMAGKERFERDVIQESGTAAVIFSIGTNDIGMVRNPKSKEWVDVQKFIQALSPLVQQAKDAGLKVFGSTIPPRGGVMGYEAAQETERQKINTWFRETDLFAAVFDFDEGLRDPGHPEQMLFAYDSGDHLHPGVLGGKRMAQCVLDTLADRKMQIF